MYKVRAINFGWYRRKHGILLENLPQLKQKLILDSGHMKWLNADVHAVEVIFKIEDQNDHERLLHKIYWNPYIEDFTELKEVEKSADLIDWHCAICNTDIKSRWDYTKVENLVCVKCSEAHNSKNKVVDHRIIESSVKFTKHCKKLLKTEQREFMSYTKKSLKK